MKDERQRKAQLEEFLLNEKRRLWHELREELTRGQDEDLSKQFELPQDLGEQSLVDQLADTGLAIADMRMQQLTKMEDALGKVREGTYGVCEDCGQEIPEERLKVDPYVACCISCQERREGRETSPHPTL